MRSGLALVAPADVHRAGKKDRPASPGCRSPGPSTCRFARENWPVSAMAPSWSWPTLLAAGWPSWIRKRRAIESVRSLPAHNIRGLAFAPDGRTLVIAHQVLNRLAQTSFDDVHWGQLIRNHLRVVRTDALLKPGSDAALLDGGRLFDLGDVGYAAGDPAGLAFDVRGNLIVALAGVDEVAITASPDQGPRRIVVGRRPTAVAPSPDGKVVYVADTLDDTISVVDIGTGQRLATISLGPRPEPTAVDRGERLFHQRQALPRRLDELPELPHRRPHQQPLERHAGGRVLWRGQASSLAAGRRGDRPLDLDGIDRPAGGPGQEVDRDDHARDQADRRSKSPT